MYKCEICKRVCTTQQMKAHNERCPHCGGQSITIFFVRCPFCHSNLGEPIEDTITSIAWGCTACKVKIYKEIS